MDTNTGTHRGTNAPRRGGAYARRGATPPASRVEKGAFKSNAPQKTELNRRPQAPSPSRDPIPSSGKMCLMASVSRSSGLEKDGDDLKNWNIQNEYRKFIQEKLDHVLKNRKRPSETETEKKSRLENQDNVLILFRKLREGVASSDRNDSFALEVYETSLYLSILFDSLKQTISITPHLFPPESDPKNATSVSQPSMFSIFCSLLYHLVAYYPSQSQYHQHLRSINEGILMRDSDVFLWFTSLTKILRTRNYARLAVLGNHPAISNVISQGLNTSNSQIVHSNLAHDAVLCLLDALRQKAAETAWDIIRSAYREFSTEKAASEVTRAWLVRSLFLESVYEGDRSIGAVEWLESKVAAGYVRKKEGQDRWIVCKTR